MREILIHSNQVDWQKQYAPRFKAGFEAHGLKVSFTNKDAADPGKINVVFANNSWKQTVQRCQIHEIPLLTVNRCFFGDRFKMVAIGWGGFNGYADFLVDDKTPPDRWEDKHGFAIPTHSVFEQGKILVCGEFRDMRPFYNKVRDEARNLGMTEDEFVWRPHPFRQNERHYWKDAPKVGQDDIDKVLCNVRACVTYDSIAGCDAVLNGVPSIAYGPYSMAKEVSFDSLSHFFGWEKRAKFKIEKWCHKLAYCQWDHDEITRGEFWEHLQRGLLKYQIG